MQPVSLRGISRRESVDDGYVIGYLLEGDNLVPLIEQEGLAEYVVIEPDGAESVQ